MAIDFSFPPEIEDLRTKVRQFVDEVVRPREAEIKAREGDRRFLIEQIVEMRTAAQESGLWLPHMPKEWGGMGLGHVELAHSEVLSTCQSIADMFSFRTKVFIPHATNRSIVM